MVPQTNLVILGGQMDGLNGLMLDNSRTTFRPRTSGEVKLSRFVLPIDEWLDKVPVKKLNCLTT